MKFTAPSTLLSPAMPGGDRRFADILIVDRSTSSLGQQGSVGTTTDGDFAGATPSQALRARVIRMVSNPPNAYAHLRDFGLRKKRGTLARPSELLTQQIQSTRQLREDPDISDASVTITNIAGAPNAYLYAVEIVDRFGNQDAFQTRVEL